MEYEILLPLGDRKLYDLVFDDNSNILKKTQVKFAGKGSDSHYSAQLRLVGGNKTRLRAKKYGDKDFHFLFVYSEDGNSYLIPWKEVPIRNSIRVDSEKYQRYKI